MVVCARNNIREPEEIAEWIHYHADSMPNFDHGSRVILHALAESPTFLLEAKAVAIQSKLEGV